MRILLASAVAAFVLAGAALPAGAAPLTVTAPVDVSIPSPFPPGCGGPTEARGDEVTLMRDVRRSVRLVASRISSRLPKLAFRRKGITVEQGADGMANTAVKAVQRLAAAAGHKIGSFKGSGSGSGGSSALIFAGPLVLLAIGLAVVSYRRMGREEDELEEEEQPA